MTPSTEPAALAERMMRAVLLTGHGGLDVLEYREDVPVPNPGPDEVLIAVSACGVNNTDINTRTGWYARSVTGPTGSQVPSGENGSWGGNLAFPRIQGADPCGRVVAVGENADRARVGERVLVDPWLRDPGGEISKARYLGSEVDGGYAEYLTVPSTNAHRIRSDLSDIELASFPCSYSTAEHMLHRTGVSEGQWVLVTGASGGVGGALVQLARRRQAHVVAMTSTAKSEAVRRLGADVVLDREAEDLAGAVLDATGGVHVLADVVGGGLFPQLLATIRRGGNYVAAGAIAGAIVELDLRTLYLNDLTFHGATVVPPAVFENLIGYIERNEIRPVVAGVFPLSEMRRAQEVFMTKTHVGALVIDVAGDLEQQVV